MDDKKRVLILCTGNSARSQMAEGLLREIGGGRFEVGIDISGQRSKSVDEFAGREFDYVVTVCDNAREECPVFPGRTQRVHWSFEDPAEAEGEWPERLAVFRRVRERIGARLREWVGGLS